MMERSLRIEKDWLRLVAVGIVGTAMYQTMFMLSVKYTSATNASRCHLFYRDISSIAQTRTFSMKVQIGSIVAFIGAAFVLLTGHIGGTTYEYAWLGNIIGLVAAIAGMVSNISATSYNKIFRNESHIMVYFNWNCTSRYILFIQRKHINVASRHKLGFTSIFNYFCDNLWASNVVCRY